METKAKLINVYQNASDDCTEIVLQVDSSSELMELKGKDVKLNIAQWSDKYSMNANRYFHKLCDLLRRKNKVSMNHQKNDLVTTYGQIDYLSDGQPIVYKTNVPPEVMGEYENPHMKYIKASEDGAYWYKVYRGTHT